MGFREREDLRQICDLEREGVARQRNPDRGENVESDPYELANVVETGSFPVSIRSSVPYSECYVLYVAKSEWCRPEAVATLIPNELGECYRNSER